MEVTTYLGHRVEVSEKDVTVYTPWGLFLVRTESMANARLAVRRARKLERAA